MTAPPDRPRPGAPIECSREYDAPVADTMVAALFFAFSIWAFESYAGGGEFRDIAMIEGIAGLVPASSYSLSAIFGYRKAARCRRMQANSITVQGDRASTHHH